MKYLTIICGLLSASLLFFSCSKSEKEKIYQSEDFVDFGKGVYRPTPFGLDKLPPFSWMEMPDSVVRETELEVAFNEDAIRSNSQATLIFTDSNGNKVSGISIYGKPNGNAKIKAGTKDIAIPIIYKVNPDVGDSILQGSIIIVSDNLDQVNETDLIPSGTPVAKWQLNHETGINWWRWFLLILIVALILVVLFYIGYGIVIGMQYLTEALSKLQIMMPRLKRKPKKKKRKEPKLFKLNIALYQRLLPRLYDLPPVLFHISYFFLPKKIKTFLKDDKVGWLPHDSWNKGTVNLSFKDSLKSIFNGKSGILKLKYKHGEIDFEPVALGKVKLPYCRLHGCIPKDAIDPRPKVWKAQEIAAEKFIKSKKGKRIIANYVGKNKKEIDIYDFTAWKDDSKNQGKKNHNPLTPHETSDGTYILYVPKKYHDVAWGGLSHNGGVHYLKKFRTYVDRKNKERQ